VTRILVSHFRGMLPALDASRQTNTSVTVVVMDQNSARIESLFDSAHVDDARMADPVKER
ncbi:MAG TPA: hypothetical protein VM052_08235, partial [Candidatus Limnocylindrales bacterium]|nr:hypothetical protein [Candidatus Limnocylindrales bacterium]